LSAFRPCGRCQQQLGELRNREEPAYLRPVARVDARDVPNSKLVPGTVHDSDLVPHA